MRAMGGTDPPSGKRHAKSPGIGANSATLFLPIPGLFLPQSEGVCAMFEAVSSKPGVVRSKPDIEFSSPGVARSKPRLVEPKAGGGEPRHGVETREGSKVYPSHCFAMSFSELDTLCEAVKVFSDL